MIYFPTGTVCEINISSTLQLLTSSLFLAGTICEISGAPRSLQIPGCLCLRACCACCAPVPAGTQLTHTVGAGTTAYLNRYHGRKRVMAYSGTLCVLELLGHS